MKTFITAALLALFAFGVGAQNIRTPSDYANARPLPPPSLGVEPEAEGHGEVVDDSASGSSRGYRGTGKPRPGLARRLYHPSDRSLADDGRTRDAYSTEGRQRAHTTSRVDPPKRYSNGYWISMLYPYRAVGKLFVTSDVQGVSSTYECSAALVARGLLVTAAHCVWDSRNGVPYRDIEFVPAFRDGYAPYGVWQVSEVEISARWRNDTPTPKLLRFGDNVAIGIVAQKYLDGDGDEDPRGKATWIGSMTGYLGRGWGDAWYNDTSRRHRETHITSLGYPTDYDRGAWMIRTDAQAVQLRDGNSSVEWGSLQAFRADRGAPGFGSDGAPVIVNFGYRTKTKMRGGTAGSKMNRVIAVTAWSDQEGNVRGPRFRDAGAGTFVPLVKSACRREPRPC